MLYSITGLDLSSSSLFWPKLSSLYTYSTPFSAKAIRALCPNGLTQKSSSITPFSDAILWIGKQKGDLVWFFGGFKSKRISDFGWQMGVLSVGEYGQFIEDRSHFYFLWFPMSLFCSRTLRVYKIYLRDFIVEYTGGLFLWSPNFSEK